MTLSDYLGEVAKLTNKIAFHQQWADKYLNEFNQRRMYEGIDVYFVDGAHKDYHNPLIEGVNEFLTDKIKDLLQQLTQWHVLERNKLENQLEDLVKTRYLENSH